MAKYIAIHTDAGHNVAGQAAAVVAVDDTAICIASLVGISQI